MLDEQQRIYWTRKKYHVLVLLGLWISYFLVIHWFIAKLNRIALPVLGFPLSTCMAVQGSLIVLAVLLFWFVRWENGIEAGLQPAKIPAARTRQKTK